MFYKFFSTLVLGTIGLLKEASRSEWLSFVFKIFKAISGQKMLNKLFCLINGINTLKPLRNYIVST